MQITYTITDTVDASFISDLNSAIAILDSTFTAPITTHLQIRYGFKSDGTSIQNQQTATSNFYSNQGTVELLNYSTLRTDLMNAVPGFFNDTNLPNTSSVNNQSNFFVSNTQARIFRLLPADAGNTID